MWCRVLWFFTLVGLGQLGLRANAQSAELPSPARATQDSIHENQSQNSTAAAATSPDASTQDSSRDSAKENASPQVPAEKRKLRLRLGGISVGAGYSRFSGPLYYPYTYGPFGLYPGDWVEAWYWYPVWSPDPYYRPGAFAYNDGRGELRLTAEPKEARVFIDGGYAGTADKLKTLWLDPGAYDLTVSAAGHEDFHQRVYVLSGRSLKITAELNADGTKEKP